MEVSILQWNVWVNEKAENILALIKKLDPDVLCLQEVTKDSKNNPRINIPEKIAELGYEAYYQPTIIRTDLIFGNGIFSRFPIKNSKAIYVQEGELKGGDPTNENRLYLEATLDIESRLTVATTHLSYTPYFEITGAKQKEVDKLVAAIGDRQSGFYFSGDLNSTPDSYTIKLLEEKLLNAGPIYSEPTWTTKPFNHNVFSANTLGWRLDYAFTSTDVNVISAKIVETEFSDHLPIMTRIKID